MSIIVRDNVKDKLSMQTKTIAAFIAIVAAVALPQIFHLIGAAIGADTAIGEKYLPMHLPVIFVGLLIGAYTGSLTGLIAPLVSFALTGMPAKPMLPFMMIELFGYGFAAGIIKNIINTEEVGAVKSLVGNAIKVFLVQVSGRALRAIAILFSFHVLGNKAIKPIIITKSISAGVVGIVIQLVAIPILLYVINGRKHE